MKKKNDASPLSDLLLLAETALSAFAGAQEKFGAHLHSKREDIVRALDLVTREEFDAAFAMLKKARAAQSDLEKRIKRLEENSRLSRAEKSPKKKQKAR